MSDRSLGRTLWNLILALLNATLILLALCLWLAWKVTDRANDLTATFAQNLIQVQPLRDEVADLRAEVAGLRGDVADLRGQSGIAMGAVAARIDVRLDAVETRVTGVTERMETILAEPEALIETAVQAAADEIVGGISTLRQCTPAAPTG